MFWIVQLGNFATQVMDCGNPARGCVYCMCVTEPFCSVKVMLRPERQRAQKLEVNHGQRANVCTRAPKPRLCFQLDCWKYSRVECERRFTRQALQLTSSQGIPDYISLRRGSRVTWPPTALKGGLIPKPCISGACLIMTAYQGSPLCSELKLPCSLQCTLYYTSPAPRLKS